MKRINYLISFICAAFIVSGCADHGLETGPDPGPGEITLSGSYKGDLTISLPEQDDVTIIEKAVITPAGENTANLLMKNVRYPVGGEMVKIGDLIVNDIELDKDDDGNIVFGPKTVRNTFAAPVGDVNATITGKVTGSKLHFTLALAEVRSVEYSENIVFNGSLMASDNESSEADIIEMSFSEDVVIAAPIINGHNIAIPIDPASSPAQLTDLQPAITLSDGATVEPASGSSVDFSEAVGQENAIRFVVTAEDLINVNVYNVYVTRELNDQSEMLSFTIEHDLLLDAPVMDGLNITFSLKPEATDDDFKGITPAIVVSPGATVSPESGSPVDFAKGEPVEFTVTAENGTDQTTYYVTALRENYHSANIISMSFDSEFVEVQPSIRNDEIVFIVTALCEPEDLEALVPNIVVSPGATVTPESGTAIDFSQAFDIEDAVEFTVTAEDGTTTKTYKAYIVQAFNDQCEITEMTIGGAKVKTQPVIDGTNIEFTMLKTTTDAEMKAIVTTMELSKGATVVPASGAAVDFSAGPVEFTVTAEDGENSEVYTVTANREKYDEAVMTSFSVTNAALIGNIVTDGTNITMYVAPETNLAALQLTPTIAVSTRATVSPASGAAVNFGSGTVTFTVTAENGTTSQVYTARVIKLNSVLYNFDEWESLGDGNTKRDDPKGWASTNPAVALLRIAIAGNYKGPWSITQSTDRAGGSGKYAIAVSTLWTEATMSQIFGAPKVTSGSLYIGSFSMETNTLESTKFGTVWDKDPLRVRGYFKYAPGPNFYYVSKKGSSMSNTTWTVDNTRTDEGTLTAVLYEASGSEVLTGVDLHTSDKIVSHASINVSSQSSWKEFNLDMQPRDGKSFDPTKSYKIALVFASSRYGDTYEGAPQSTLTLDDVEVLSIPK